MKISLLSGIVILVILAVLGLFDPLLFLKVIAIISAATFGLSGVFLGSFVKRSQYIQDLDPNEERWNRKIGLTIAAFGFPFIITTIITVLVQYEFLFSR
ncbi:hypothetical protein [Pseudalkalibacillus berkeleyi]|uniref:DUF5316 domain-containing protein n=1 Tax=Pseudalkalibacillus berkeleyi TaxID=1069813 RepID=A0ABS9H0N7_9BACL|nr:hypothetical protein [Pseudalkalibacillus berkeleyi]MCF6137505.1 hypothetical protein [Pseudalkalibacillus berkeleyi]